LPTPSVDGETLEATDSHHDIAVGPSNAMVQDSLNPTTATGGSVGPIPFIVVSPFVLIPSLPSKTSSLRHESDFFSHPTTFPGSAAVSAAVAFFVLFVCFVTLLDRPTLFPPP
jgi:hypothetical protein